MDVRVRIEAFFRKHRLHLTARYQVYDPDGKAGIINITIKRGATDGLTIAANALGGLQHYRLR